MRISDWSSDVCSSDLVPAGAGVASAFGFLAAPLSITLLQAYPVELRRVDHGHLKALFAALEAQGREFLAKAGVRDSDMVVQRFASLRYRGQGSDRKSTRLNSSH